MHKNTRVSRFFGSLKCRLFLLVIIISVLPGLILRFGVLSSYEDRAVSLRTSEIQSQVTILANQIAGGNYISFGSLTSDVAQAQIGMFTTVYDGRVILVDQAYRIVYDTYNLDERKTIIVEEVIRSFGGESVTNYDSDNHYIEMSVPISDPTQEDAEISGVMLVSVSTDSIEYNRQYLSQVAFLLELFTTIALIFFGVLYVNHAMKPFAVLSEEVQKVRDGYGDDSLSVDTYTETQRLCRSVNAMLDRIKVMEESRQEFVSNVSHELKTPMTSMKALADSLNSMPDAPIELYQEFMADITDEVDRENKIINDLLSMVKMDKTSAEPDITSVNVNDLLEQILKRLQPIADGQKVEMVLESFRPVTADADETRLTLIVSNLVENAVKYNRSDKTGWVHISLNSDHQYFYIRVEDNGPGIPEESLPHIYERFYRVDKSHSRETGGTGLGLSIVRSAVSMLHGQIRVHSVVGEGTTFDVRIPLIYTQQQKKES